MMRLIDADALLKDITDYPYGYRGMIKDTIARQPTVDAVKHGHWKEDEARIKDQCSACGISVNWSRFKTPYCPFCGAKMDKEVER